MLPILMNLQMLQQHQTSCEILAVVKPGVALSLLDGGRVGKEQNVVQEKLPS